MTKKKDKMWNTRHNMIIMKKIIYIILDSLNFLYKNDKNFFLSFHYTCTIYQWDMTHNIFMWGRLALCRPNMCYLHFCVTGLTNSHHGQLYVKTMLSVLFVKMVSIGKCINRTTLQFCTKIRVILYIQQCISGLPVEFFCWCCDITYEILYNQFVLRNRCTQLYKKEWDVHFKFYQCAMCYTIVWKNFISIHGNHHCSYNSWIEHLLS